MVSLNTIRESNALLRHAKTLFVAAFFGGTSGIGMATIKALVATGTTSKIYLVGRQSSARRMASFIRDSHAINPQVEVVWMEAEIALLAETKRVCEEIKERENHVDLLFMTAGYAPFSAREETAEGLEVTQSLEYYSRMLSTMLLLPLLENSEAPRVVSVLAGGMEPAAISLDDLYLRKPTNFGGFKSQRHYAAMNTMTLERLAESSPHTTFIHSFPGWVSTGNHRRGADMTSTLGRLVWPIVDPLISLCSYSDEESGQRHLFESTSAAFGGRGVLWDGQCGVNSLEKPTNGLFLVNQKGNCTTNTKAIRALRQSAREAIWDHTQEAIGSYL